MKKKKELEERLNNQLQNLPGLTPEAIQKNAGRVICG